MAVYALNVRLDEEHRVLLDTLSTRRRRSKNQIIEIALERFAASEVEEIKDDLKLDADVMAAFERIRSEDAGLLERLAR